MLNIRGSELPEGTCNANMDEIYFFRQLELRFMWWWLVIDHPHKSFDNCHNQELAFR